MKETIVFLLGFIVDVAIGAGALLVLVLLLSLLSGCSTARGNADNATLSAYASELDAAIEAMEEQ